MRTLWVRVWVALLLLAGATGCTVPLVEDLSEQAATEVVVALDRSDIGAMKERDPTAEGRFRVSVASEDVAIALTTLSDHGLPGRHVPGVLESLGEGGLVPSRASERARVLVGTAGELEQSLREVSGVLTARVHLAAPEADPLAGDDRREASASVLLRHAGATPPIAPDDVRQLVAGAVGGLAPDHVAVVLNPVAPRAGTSEGRLARLGPLTIARSSASTLRWVLLGVGALNVVLVLGALMLWGRLRKTQQELTAQRGTSLDTLPESSS